MLIVAAIIGYFLWKRHQRIKEEAPGEGAVTITLPGGSKAELKWSKKDAAETKKPEEVKWDFSDKVAQQLGCLVEDPSPPVSTSRSSIPNAASYVRREHSEDSGPIVDLDHIPGEPDPGIDVDDVQLQMKEVASSRGHSRTSILTGTSARQLVSSRSSKSNSPQHSTPVAGNRSRSGSPRSGREIPAYWKHEWLEYYSASYGKWTHGFIHRYDGHNGDIVMYQVVAGAKLDLRRLVNIDLLRRPLERGEDVSVQNADKEWVPATILDESPISLHLRKYTISIKMHNQEEPLVIPNVSAELIRRRYKKGTEVFVYLNPIKGWHPGVVIEEVKDEEGKYVKVPAVRPEWTSATNLPEWCMVKIDFSGSSALQCGEPEKADFPSYQLSTKDHRKPTRVPPGELIRDYIPPWPNAAVGTAAAASEEDVSPIAI